jgi:DNA-binding response OmpR family regulator
VILLIEDSPDDEALALQALGKQAITVLRDGLAAREWLSSTVDAALDVVLLDLHIPFVRGLDLLRLIRAQPHTRHVPVVVLTGSRDPSDLVNSYLLGANSFVPKPNDARNFTEAVRAIARYWLEINRPPPREL